LRSPLSSDRVFRRKKIHREMDALQRATFDRQSRGLVRARANQDRIKLIHQLRRRDVFANLAVAFEGDAFRAPFA